MWRKLKAVAHTLPYDVSIVAGHQQGVPFHPSEWDAVTVPTVVFAGGKSPAWMKNAMEALAGTLPAPSTGRWRGRPTWSRRTRSARR